jgi:hypothetical protein
MKTQHKFPMFLQSPSGSVQQLWLNEKQSIDVTGLDRIEESHLVPLEWHLEQGYKPSTKNEFLDAIIIAEQVITKAKLLAWKTLSSMTEVEKQRERENDVHESSDFVGEREGGNND